jgi:hypothetical protein
MPWHATFTHTPKCAKNKPLTNFNAVQPAVSAPFNDQIARHQLCRPVSKVSKVSIYKLNPQNDNFENPTATITPSDEQNVIGTVSDLFFPFNSVQNQTFVNPKPNSTRSAVTVLLDAVSDSSNSQILSIFIIFIFSNRSTHHQHPSTEFASAWFWIHQIYKNDKNCKPLEISACRCRNTSVACLRRQPP